MRKTHLFYSVSIFLAVFLFGCATRYVVNKESPTLQSLGEYKKIHMDWLDLKENDWEVYGYGSMQEWKQEIHDMNVLGLHKYIKEFLPRKEYSFATSVSDENAKDMELQIKFSDCGIVNYQQVPFRPGHVDLSVTVHFIDTKTNREIYSVAVTTYGYNKWGMNFEERLNSAVYYLAEFIALKFK